ncbi:hypothetical protein ACLKA6_007062 [Drosophila palustris]
MPGHCLSCEARRQTWHAFHDGHLVYGPLAISALGSIVLLMWQRLLNGSQITFLLAEKTNKRLEPKLQNEAVLFFLFTGQNLQQLSDFKN